MARLRDAKGRFMKQTMKEAKEADLAAVENFLLRRVGQPREKVAQQLYKYLTPASTSGLYTARRLVRNEISFTFNQATKNEAIQFDQLVKYNTTGTYKPSIDNGVCMHHAEGHSDGYPKGVYLPSEVPVPPTHVNCRCFLTPVNLPREDLVIVIPAPPETTPPTTPIDEGYKGYDLSGMSEKKAETFKRAIDEEWFTEKQLKEAISKAKEDWALLNAPKPEPPVPTSWKSWQVRLVEALKRTEAAIIQLLEGPSKDWTDSLKKDDLWVLKNWTVFGFKQINDGLRGHSNVYGQLLANIERMDRVLDQAPSYDEEIVVYRGLSKSSPLHPSNDPELGLRVTDPAFVSTSTKIKVAHQFANEIPDGAVIEIRIPAGTKVPYIQGISTRPDEDEVLLPRRTTFEVIGHSEQGNVTVMVVPDTEMKPLSENETLLDLRKRSEQWLDDAEYGVKQIVAAYADEGYERFNGFLRSGKEPTPEIARALERIDEFLETAPTSTRPTILYRGVSSRNPLHPDNLPEIGLRVTDPAYVSTSVKAGTARFFADMAQDGEVIEITVPPGNPLPFIERIAKSKTEAEVLLPRDATFEVTGRNADGRVTVEYKKHKIKAIKAPDDLSDYYGFNLEGLKDWRLEEYKNMIDEAVRTNNRAVTPAIYQPGIDKAKADQAREESSREYLPPPDPSKLKQPTKVTKKFRETLMEEAEVDIDELPRAEWQPNRWESFGPEFMEKRQPILDLTNPWIESLNLAQMAAIADYARPVGNEDLNYGLREGLTDSAMVKRINNIDAVLSTAPRTTEDIIVYRGIGLGSPLHSSENPEPGSVITDRGYVSTTINEDVAQNYVEAANAEESEDEFQEDFSEGSGEMVEILIPAGTPLAYIERLSATPEEFEVLLPRSSSFEVTGENADNGRLQLTLIANDALKPIEGAVLNVEYEMWQDPETDETKADERVIPNSDLPAPAKTLSEAEKRARDLGVTDLDYGYSIFGDNSRFGSAEAYLNVANSTNAALEQVVSRGYSIPKSIQFREEFWHKDTLAYYDTYTEGLVVNLASGVGDNDSSVVKELHEKGWLVSETVKDVMIHELGHFIHFNMERPDGAGKDDFLLDYQESLEDREIMMSISGYATTDLYEYVAEAFTYQMKGNKLTEDQQRLYDMAGGPLVSSATIRTAAFKEKKKEERSIPVDKPVPPSSFQDRLRNPQDLPKEGLQDPSDLSRRYFPPAPRPKPIVREFTPLKTLDATMKQIKMLGVEVAEHRDYMDSSRKVRRGYVKVMHSVSKTLHQMAAEGHTLPRAVRIIREPSLGDMIAFYQESTGTLTLNMAHEAWETDDPDSFLAKESSAGFIVPRSVEEAVIHELGHHLHATESFPLVSVDDGERRPSAPEYVDAWEDEDDWDTAAEISAYAASTPAEFVAEAYTLQRRGEKLTPKQLALYKKLNGPEVIP